MADAPNIAVVGMSFREGPNAVRVCDVSQSGAAIETTLKLGVGDGGALCFYQLDGQPTVHVVVRNVVPGLNRIGLAFVAPAVSCGLYVLVALIWLVPDRRFERAKEL